MDDSARSIKSARSWRALLYAGDRFESRELLLAAQRDNDYVVLDRYVASNIGHQASKVTGEERQEIIAWINKIEYEIYALPQPDVTILLNLPPPARKN